jgi:hypothetical protein
LVGAYAVPQNSSWKMSILRSTVQLFNRVRERENWPRADRKENAEKEQFGRKMPRQSGCLAAKATGSTICDLEKKRFMTILASLTSEVHLKLRRSDRLSRIRAKDIFRV